MHGLRGKACGFTLLELLTALAVAAVLLAIAIPSYRSTITRNAMAAQVNDLVGDLNYARSQAVTRGAPVYLCKSSDQHSCTTSGNWSQGWIVFAPGPDGASPAPTSDNLLHVRGPLAQQVEITGNNNIENDLFFDANGFAMGSIGTFTARASGSAQQTRIVIASTGRIRTETTAVAGSDP